MQPPRRSLVERVERLGATNRRDKAEEMLMKVYEEILLKRTGLRGTPDELTNEFNRKYRYLKVPPLGSGTFGEAVLAERKKDAARVVVKRIHVLKHLRRVLESWPEELDAEAVVSRLVTDAWRVATEVLALRRLHACPDHVVQYLDAYYDPAHVLLLVMEYTEGVSLSTLLVEKLIDNPSNVRKVARQLAQGLTCFHRNEVVHRDIKPNNVIASASLSNARWIDFGVSCYVECTSAMTGNNAFIAPEIYTRQFDWTFGSWRAADVWSFGQMVYYMLNGQRPMYQTAVSERAQKRTWRNHTPRTRKPIAHNHPADPWLRALFDATMVPNPATRLQRWKAFVKKHLTS